MWIIGHIEGRGEGMCESTRNVQLVTFKEDEIEQYFRAQTLVGSRVS